MTTPSDPIETYLSWITPLRLAVEGMTVEQLRARPIPGKWSTMEVVCHLADFESIYADRIKRIIAVEKPLYLDAGHNAYAANLAYHDRDLHEELNVIESTRRSLARTLQALGPASLERVGTYRDAQGVETEKSAAKLLTTISGHIHHHLVHVFEKRKALGFS